MACVVRLQESDGSLTFLLWNLPENILGKVMLELGEGSHPVVDAVKENENDQTGKGAKSKANQKTFDQARPNRDRPRRAFHDSNDIAGIDHLRDIDVFQAIGEMIIKGLLAIDLVLNAIELGQALA